MLNKVQTLSDLRKYAKELNMTFRFDKSNLIGGSAAYELICRKTKDVLVENMTLESAYAFYMEGGFTKAAKKGD